MTVMRTFLIGNLSDSRNFSLSKGKRRKSFRRLLRVDLSYISQNQLESHYVRVTGIDAKEVRDPFRVSLYLSLSLNPVPSHGNS